MNKSNVTLPYKSVESGFPPLFLTDDQLIGYVIYRPDTEEFFHTHNSGIAYSSNAFTKEPSLAFYFSSKQIAFTKSKFISQPTEILPLYDLGDKFVVVFNEI